MEGCAEPIVAAWSSRQRLGNVGPIVLNGELVVERPSDPVLDLRTDRPADTVAQRVPGVLPVPERLLIVEATRIERPGQVKASLLGDHRANGASGFLLQLPLVGRVASACCEKRRQQLVVLILASLEVGDDRESSAQAEVPGVGPQTGGGRRGPGEHVARPIDQRAQQLRLPVLRGVAHLHGQRLEGVRREPVDFGLEWIRITGGRLAVGGGDQACPQPCGASQASQRDTEHQGFADALPVLLAADPVARHAQQGVPIFLRDPVQVRLLVVGEGAEPPLQPVGGGLEVAPLRGRVAQSASLMPP